MSDDRGRHHNPEFQRLQDENRRLRARLREAEENAGPMPNLDPEPIGYAPGAFESGVPVTEWVYDAATNQLGPPR